MTISEYLHYQTPPGFRDELIRGELILSPSAKPRHNSICTRIYEILSRLVREEFVVNLDTTMILSEEDAKDGSGPRPDVFVIDRERWEQAERLDAYPTGSPQLVVEVLSPSTEAEDNKKAVLYLDTGAYAVWLVDPDKREVQVLTRDLGPRTFGSGDRLPLPDVTHPFAAGVNVEEIF